MKSILIAVLLIGSLAQAQYLTPGNGDGHMRPNRPGHGGHNLQPSPFYPSYPGYSDYGPARTYRWVDQGENRIDKFITETVRVRANDRLVNEILFRAKNADVQIVRAYARLSNGRITNISTGTIRQGRDARVRLDYQYSLRVDEIIIEATSPNVIGSRARLQIYLGLAE